LPGYVVTVRKLGKSDETVQMDAGGLTLAATGNNAVFSRDMAWRCYFIRLDAKMEAPERRTAFGITDLRAHIRERRLDLLRDVLTILGAWIEAGRPEGKARKGSFDRWAAVLSGVLDMADVLGFLDNDAERAEAADRETLARRSFSRLGGRRTERRV
jgi:DNA polymerase-1